jgi:DNA-binding transcriptional MocR family regulator
MSSTLGQPGEAEFWESVFARRASRMQGSEVRELLKLLALPGIISFAGGIPDPALFPIKAAAHAYADILSHPATASQALQYSVSEGYPPLKEDIIGLMSELGVIATQDNIIITAGSQQALDFMGKLLLSPGDTALVPAPTFLGALQAFSAYEPRYDTIRPELGNRSPQSYVEAASAGGADTKVKFVYAVPDFDNPTGVTMSLDARERLLALARELDIAVLEDSAYQALRFSGQTVPTLQAMDIAQTGSLDASRVVYLGTFSKTVAPGLRIGWVCASRELISGLVLVKQASDLTVPAINQMVMHRIVSEEHEALIAQARALYQGKRDAMLAALDEYMPKNVQWTRPEGGLFVWVTLPEGIDAHALLKRAVAEVGVAFVPGSAFYHDGSGANTIRLSYSLPDVTAITEGIRRLATLL